MKRTERDSVEKSVDDADEAPSSARKSTLHTLFNTTHQAVAYTAIDGKTVHYIDPKTRVAVAPSDFSEELKGLLHNGTLVDETSATE